jgi:hypothetical protein
MRELKREKRDQGIAEAAAVRYAANAIAFLVCK